MKEESVSVKQGKKALFYLIVQYQTDKIEAERTIQMGNGNRGNTNDHKKWTGIHTRRKI